ncbi:hypothetical protein [Enterobacter roggenkampii]|uniref:hypothetical protein n=1 Tax=Enterobacter roggenkampii TaxID=1812935 RepID=UPI002003F5F5|nr:hypothetical protein [Enterobacter roggenkampii]MCK6984047.1 hypothetical protein [Enterobacter roggenkampii]
MSNIDKQARDKLKSASAKAVDNFDPNMFVETRDVLALLDELEAAEKRIAEMQALASGVKQFSEFQICHYGTTEDCAEGYIDCQSNYNKVLFAAAGKGE